MLSEALTLWNASALAPEGKDASARSAAFGEIIGAFNAYLEYHSLKAAVEGSIVFLYKFSNSSRLEFKGFKYSWCTGLLGFVY